MNQLPSTIARECRYQQWAQDVHDCRNSGLSVPEWCEQHHLGVKSYYYRLKKVRSMLIEENPEIVKLVPENFSSTPSGADIVVGSATIHVDDNTSVSLLSNIFKALADA